MTNLNFKTLPIAPLPCKAASATFKTGGSNSLEKTRAETQRLGIQMLERQNLDDIEISSLRLKGVLKSESSIAAADEVKKRAVPVEISAPQIQSNPTLKF